MVSITAPTPPAPPPRAKSGVVRWAKILGRELTTVAITIFGLLLVTFLIARVMPIDPVLAVVGDRAPADVYDKARLALGLDKPYWQQFAVYIGKVLPATSARRC